MARVVQSLHASAPPSFLAPPSSPPTLRAPSWHAGGRGAGATGSTGGGAWATMFRAAGAGAAVITAAATTAAARRRQQRRRGGAAARKGYASNTQTYIITPNIWTMLKLDPSRDGKEEIRKSYKQFVLREHPDTREGAADPEFVERFNMVTTEYKMIMKTDDDLFWVHQFDARVMADTKRKQEYRQARTAYRRYAMELELKEAEKKAAEFAKLAEEQGLPLPGEEKKEEEGLRADEIVGGILIGGAGTLLLAFTAVIITASGS